MEAATKTLTAALSETQDQPGVTFRALEAVAQARLGVRLFTIMELDRERGCARRSYSNMSHAYPVSGEKPIERNEWLDQIERQEMFVANSIDEDIFRVRREADAEGLLANGAAADTVAPLA